MLSRRCVLQLLGLGSAALPSLQCLDAAEPVSQSDAHHGMQLASAKKQVAVLLYENAILFDYGPPAEIFRVAEWTNAFNVFTVGLSTAPMLNMFFPREIKADFRLEDSPKTDVVVIPGGDWATIQQRAERGDRKMLLWIRDCLESGTTVLGVCTGAYILALAGLLDGRRATSLPFEIENFRRLAPKTDVREDMLFVDDGNIVTASGGYAGIDAALHIVRRIRGVEAARFVANDYLNYDNWSPTFTGQVKN